MKEYGLDVSRWLDVFKREQILRIEDLNDFLNSTDGPFDHYATAVEKKKFSRMKAKADSMKRLKDWVNFAELETDKWVTILGEQGIVTEEDLLKVTDAKAAVIAMKSRDIGEQKRVQNLFRLDLRTEDDMVRCLKGCRIYVAKEEVHEHNCAATTNAMLREMKKEIKELKRKVRAMEARVGSSV